MADSSAPARTGLATVLLLFLGANWGIAFSFAKFGQLGGIPPLGYAIWQSGGAGVVLLAICLFRGALPPLSARHMRYYLIAALTGQAIPIVNMLIVLKEVPVGVFAVLVTLSPLLTYGMAMLAGMERFSLRRFAGMLLGFGGALLILVPRSSLPSPDMAPWVALALVTPLFFAGSNIYIARARPEGVDSLALASAMQLAVVLFVVPVAAVTGTLYIPGAPLSTGDIAMLAHVATASFGALVMFEVIRLAGVVFMSQVAYIVTLNGIFWGWVFFDEHHSPWIWAALVVVLSGVALVTKPPRRDSENMRKISEAAPDIAKAMAQNPVGPVGTISFRLLATNLSDPKAPAGRILEAVSGAHVFRLARNDKCELQYFHSSPGTGTRVATIKLEELPIVNFRITFNWSPEKIQLFVHYEPSDKQLYADGEASIRQLRVSRGGSVMELGGAGLELMEVRVFSNGQKELEPTAIEAWETTKKVVAILLSGKSEDGHIFEVAVSNACLSSIVTGFEMYSKARFLEIKREGIYPNIEEAAKIAYRSKKMRAQELAEATQEARNANISVLEQIIDVERRISFQNFDTCAKAYKKVYGIRFSDLGLSQDELAEVKKLFQFRHKIVHISPLYSPWNLLDSPPEEPRFSNKKSIQESISKIDAMISALHAATLRLRRPEKPVTPRGG